MPAKQPITSRTSLDGLDDKTITLIGEALLAGRCVQWEFSLVTDPGMDYSKILIDQKCIKFIPGY